MKHELSSLPGHHSLLFLALDLTCLEKGAEKMRISAVIFTTA